MRIHAVSLAIVAALVVSASAQSPFAGKWKMNPAKSNFGEITMLYETLPAGEMKATAEGQSYTFRTDGKDYPAPFDRAVAWTALSGTSWRAVWKMKGKVLATDTLTLSPDGNTLTSKVTGTKPNGDPIDDTVVSTRVSGGPGLAGKWKTKNMSSSSPSVLEFVPSGGDGLAYKVVDMGLSCESKVDGQDHPCTGPTLGQGWTVSMASAGPRSMDMTVKNGGKVLYKVNYTISADGRTLTETGSSTATGEKVTVVYDRQ